MGRKADSENKACKMRTRGTHERRSSWFISSPLWGCFWGSWQKCSFGLGSNNPGVAGGQGYCHMESAYLDRKE